jgi:enolase
MGANAILAVSLACAKAAAVSEGKELFEHLRFLFDPSLGEYKLPTPMFNILNGGQHAVNGLDIQETMIVPIGIEGFEKKLRAGSEIYHVLRHSLINKGFSVGLGDEGGFSPDFTSNEACLESAQKAILEAGYTVNDVRLSLDVAATEFFKEGRYVFKKGDLSFSSEEFIEKLLEWNNNYNFLSIEDGLDEGDSNWAVLTEKLGQTISVGDDLFTTNPARIKEGIAKKEATGVIIKPNQIGSLSETLEAIRESQQGGLKVIVSHRSGETEDTFIADLAVAVGADFIKSGAPARSERLAKYNRLSLIEDLLKEYY